MAVPASGTSTCWGMRCACGREVDVLQFILDLIYVLKALPSEGAALNL